MTFSHKFSALHALSAVVCAQAFTPLRLDFLLPCTRLKSCRPALTLRMITTKPAVPLAAERSENFITTSFAHPQPVRHTLKSNTLAGLLINELHS